MKRILLVTTLTLSSIINAQRTVFECFEKAKPFLLTNECNTTGIAWIEGVLKIDPDNVEAKKIIKNCTDIKFNEAINSLKSDITNLKSIDVLSKILINHSEYDTEEANYLLAKANLEDGVSHNVKNYIDRAIVFNDKNIDYRWIRFLCNMLDNGSREQYKQAISDLNFMIENGFKTATIYSNLGLAEYQLGSAILRFSEINKNNSYTDDISAEKRQRKAIIEETILHFTNSKINYQKGLDIDKKGFQKNIYEIQKIDNEIPELREQLKKLS